MSGGDFDAFLTLAESLKREGWVIVKFEDLGGGIALTIVPSEQKTPEAE
jgi:hypothetical protein